MKLTAKNLCVDRSGRRIISDVSFVLKRGTALIVTGPNGSGKSTLLRAIAGLLPIAEGEVTLSNAGEDGWREHYHYLGHQNGLKPILSVSENLEFWRCFSGNSDLTVKAALKSINLGHARDLPLRYLSAGQQRRVALARLLVNRKPVWIVDEPTSGLDQASAKRFVTLAKGFCASGGILVAATHLPLGIAGAKKLELKPVQIFA